jgi:hypothetical protein
MVRARKAKKTSNFTKPAPVTGTYPASSQHLSPRLVSGDSNPREGSTAKQIISEPLRKSRAGAMGLGGVLAVLY